MHKTPPTAMKMASSVIPANGPTPHMAKYEYRVPTGFNVINMLIPRTMEKPAEIKRKIPLGFIVAHPKMQPTSASAPTITLYAQADV
nr:hypothetical protein [Candidatus Sigynarchaeum springense]